MEISSKLSLYEFLTMLVVGGILLEMIGVHIPSSEGEINWFIYSVLSFTMGLVFHRSIEWFLNIMRNVQKNQMNSFSFRIAFPKNSKDDIKNAQNDVQEQVDSKSIIHKYYTAYYRIMSNSCYNVIERLEAQEAFYRDLFVLLVINAVLLLKQDYDAGLFHWIFGKEYLCKEWLAFLIFGLILIFVIGFTKKKIYELVWSGYYYTENNTDNKNDK